MNSHTGMTDNHAMIDHNGVTVNSATSKHAGVTIHREKGILNGTNTKPETTAQHRTRTVGKTVLLIEMDN